MLSLVLEWLKEKGGLDAIEKRNEQKAGFYTTRSTKAADSTAAMREKTAAQT
jgi:phosphoserine aminotransferase